MVGNFEPSYTEYVTDYVLTEVWLDGESGFLIKTFKGTTRRTSSRDGERTAHRRAAGQAGRRRDEGRRSRP
jgi:hypothetical protein